MQSPLKPAAALSLLTAPLLFLGALLSKMDTIERYYTQLWVVGTVALLCVIASIGSLLKQPWAEWLLAVLYGVAAAFWLYSAFELAQASAASDLGFGLAAFPAAIGIVCMGFAVALFLHCQSQGLLLQKVRRSDDA
jgi:hypothetical protein